MLLHFLYRFWNSYKLETSKDNYFGQKCLQNSMQHLYTNLVKSAGTGAVTKEAMGLQWNCLNICRSSVLWLIRSFFPLFISFWFIFWIRVSNFSVSWVTWPLWPRYDPIKVVSFKCQKKMAFTIIQTLKRNMDTEIKV